MMPKYAVENEGAPRAAGDVRIRAVLLAAGLSRRMGQNKLLMEYGGRPLCEGALKVLHDNAACFCERLLVGRLPEHAALAEKWGFTYVHNDEPQRGIGHSAALGAGAPGAWDGCLLALADMPDLRPGTVYALCRAFAQSPENIAVPVYGGKRGNPAVFPARLRAELAALDGDSGGRAILVREQARLTRVQVYDPGVLRDIDTPEDLQRHSKPLL